MTMSPTPQSPLSRFNLPEAALKELQDYGEWIQKYRIREIGEIKMQKIRLQLGTYAQRQDGVQMQRIKFPGGTITSDQLVKLADVADKYASGFIHFTTREDAQLYYIKLEECPEMMAELASAGITTREACGNTIRNITACYRSGVSATEVFNVTPYAHALFRFLLRNKFNQVMGRKFKIAFEGCEEDHAGMRFHDFGFKAVTKKENGRIRRGFRTYIGGGLGGTPMLTLGNPRFFNRQRDSIISSQRVGGGIDMRQGQKILLQPFKLGSSLGTRNHFDPNQRGGANSSFPQQKINRLSPRGVRVSKKFNPSRRID